MGYQCLTERTVRADDVSRRSVPADRLLEGPYARQLTRLQERGSPRMTHDYLNGLRLPREASLHVLTQPAIDSSFLGAFLRPPSAMFSWVIG
jgi:hypothetical protein